MARAPRQNNSRVGLGAPTWHQAPVSPRALAYATIAVVIVAVLMTAQGIDGRLSAAARAVASAKGRAALGARAHQGEGPCLRYLDARDIPATETASAARALVAAGLTPWTSEVLLVTWRWSREDEARHHASTVGQEYAEAVLDELSAVDRLWLSAVGRNRLLELTDTGTAAEAALTVRAERALARLPEEDVVRVRALWQKLPRPFARPAEVGLVPAIERASATP